MKRLLFINAKSDYTMPFFLLIILDKDKKNKKGTNAHVVHIVGCVLCNDE